MQCFSSLLLGVLTAVAAPDVPPRPNIVVVLADDFGCGDVGCYGGRHVATPQLDRMAAAGTRFGQAYVAAPICSPSRCGLITGQFPARWRITSYLQTREGNRACEQADYLDPAAPSLPRALHEAGYATAHIGKWHLGGGRDVTDAPKFAAYGYDLGLGTYESPERAPALGRELPPWSEQIEPQQVPRHARTAWMVDRTLDFLREHAQQPCFVNLWLDDTHTPFRPSAEQLAAVGVRGKASQLDRYRAVLAELDRQVGRLLDGIRAGGQAERTLVIFLGDNGALPTFDQSRTGGFRGSKLSLYEGGIRIPLIAWWPGHVPAGQVNETTVISAVDFFPTLARLAGAQVSATAPPDGQDLSAALLGEKPVRGKPLLWEYGRNGRSFVYPADAKHRSPSLAIRDGRWKLLVHPDGLNAELYDIEADPQETRDLAAAEPETTRRLTEHVIGWRKSVP